MTNVKFMNPFVEAASKVLMAEANLDVRKGSISLQKSAVTVDEITVLVNLVGHVQGVVLYGMPVKTGLALVSRMIDREFIEFDDLAQSGIAELGNVITGQASIKLAECGYSSTISSPTLILGNGVQISTLDFPRILVPLDTYIGIIFVHLALRENPLGSQS